MLVSIVTEPQPGENEEGTHTCHKVSDSSEHGDAAVLDFGGAKTVEVGPVTVSAETHGVKVTEGGSGTDLVSEGSCGEGGGCLASLGRGEGGGGAEEGGEDGDGLHGWCC